MRGICEAACSQAVAERISRHRRFLVALVLVAGSAMRPAGADQFDVFNVVLGGSVRRDSNLFKRPTAVSDTISSGYVGLRVDKPYSQQRFQLDITENTTRYDSNSRLDFDALDYRGAWLWQLGSRLSGTLSADRKENLVPFEDTLGNNQRNVRISENRAFTLDGWVSGGWHVLAGVSQRDQKSDQTVQTEPDFRAVNAEAGIKYEAPSGYSVTGTRRSTNGEYVNQAVIPASIVNRDYHQDETELRMSWTLSAKSSVNGRLAWIERTNSDPSLTRFSGPSGDLSYTWMPTGKLSFNVSGARNTNALLDPSFSYSETDTLSFAPTWRASDKTTVSLRVARTNLKYRGTGSVPATGPARSDTTDTVELNVGWSPMRSLSIGASVQRQKRTSNDPFFGYDATIGSINGSLIF